jgi:hypothetical protein
MYALAIIRYRRPLGTLDRVRDEGPYVTFGLAKYEVIPWVVGIGKEDLDKIGV